MTATPSVSVLTPTAKRNMKRNNCSTIEEYRLIRKRRKQAVKAIQQAKYRKALTGRKAKVSKLQQKKK